MRGGYPKQYPPEAPGRLVLSTLNSQLSTSPFHSGVDTACPKPLEPRGRLESMAIRAPSANTP